MNISIFFTRIFKYLADLLYPPMCHCCEAPLIGLSQNHLCSDCFKRLKFFGDNSCWFCSHPLGKFVARQKECDECHGRERKYTRVVATCEYNDAARSLIHAFKFCNFKPIYLLLSELMIRRFIEEYSGISFDYILAVPLHKNKMAERGYNQSDLLAKELSCRLGLPHSSDLLQRIRNTPSQALLNSQERENNLRGAFEVTKTITSAKILLIDDVYTTGSTASECACALRKAGASRVYVLVFAR